jgi:hypothetical protein
MLTSKIGFILFSLVAALSLSCSPDEGLQPEIAPVETSPFQQLYDQGVDRYLGTITPISSTPTGPGVTQHVFRSEDGPVCFTGNQFSMFTRDGSSNNLMIFLQGGGFCAPNICEAVEVGIPFIPFGILNPNDPQNPVANYDVGYVPYCDGSMMSGDNEVDSDGDGVNDRFFKGLQNLSASLDVIFQNFPSPEKIVLAGNSAGGYAVHIALPLVRKRYPEARIYVVNDSGQGIANPGGMALLFGYWNAEAFIPASCMDCIGEDGNLTGLHAYQLAKDENIRMAYISSKQDSVTSASMGGAVFEAELIESATELNIAHPERFQSLIDNGDAHTYIIRSFNVEVGGVTVRQWLADMINESAGWETVIE